MRQAVVLATNDQEHIEGRDPATGEPDPSRDGTITSTVPLARMDMPTEFVHPQPKPDEDGLLVAQRTTELLVTRDLAAALAGMVDDQEARFTPDGLLVSRDQRRPR